MNLLKNLINFTFIIVYVIHKMLVFLNDNVNCLKDNIFECLFNERNRFLFFFKKIIFSITYNNGKFKSRKLTKDIRNLFSLKEELNYTAIKNKKYF